MGREHEIVRTINTLAQNLGMGGWLKVLEQEQLEQLKSMKCTLGQVICSPAPLMRTQQMLSFKIIRSFPPL